MKQRKRKELIAYRFEVLLIYNNTNGKFVLIREFYIYHFPKVFLMKRGCFQRKNKNTLL